MLQYPSILGAKHAALGKQCIAFYKYDGSNLRWEWSPKKGWNKSGTRRHMFDSSDPIYGEAIPYFMENLADDIVYRTKQIVGKPERITAFTEFFGPGSFAGNHVEGEEKELRLFDIFLFRKGFVPPKQFVEIYGSMPQAAEVIYQGEITAKFIMDVRKGKYPVFEGVVAKGHDFSFKIKTAAYFEKLRHHYQDRWLEYAE